MRDIENQTHFPKLTESGVVTKSYFEIGYTRSYLEVSKWLVNGLKPAYTS